MVSWRAHWQWNAVTSAVNQDNTIVEASKTIIPKHLKPFVVIFSFTFGHMYTGIQTLYQMQPNYKCLVNSAKMPHLRHYSTGRLTQSDLKMCLSNHVLWEQGRFSKGSTINYHTGRSQDRDISCVCKHSNHDWHWTSVTKVHTITFDHQNVDMRSIFIL